MIRGIDGCLHHGDGGVEFAERLVALGGRVSIPTTLNVGALDLLRPDRVKAHASRKDMALRQMRAYEDLGCQPTWTCAPYQVGHRPRLGQHVAWEESNAVVFAGRLRIDWSYGANRHDQEHIRRYLASFREALTRLVEESVANPDSSEARSEISDGLVSQDELDDLLLEFGDDDG